MLRPGHRRGASPQCGCSEEVQIPDILPALKTLAPKAWGGFAMNSRSHNSHCNSHCRPGDLSHRPAGLSTSVPSLGLGAATDHLAMVPGFLTHRTEPSETSLTIGHQARPLSEGKDPLWILYPDMDGLAQKTKVSCLDF